MRNKRIYSDDETSMTHLKDVFYRTPAACPWEFTGFVAEIPLSEEEAESFKNTLGAEVSKSSVKELTKL